MFLIFYICFNGSASDFNTMNTDSFLKYLNKISFFLKKARWQLYYIVLLLILLIIVVRHPFLHFAVNKAVKKIQYITNDTVTIGDYNFSGVRGVFIKDINVYNTERKDTLFHADSIFVKIRIFPLLTGKIRFSEIVIKNADVLIIKEGDFRNYGFLFAKEKTDTAKHQEAHVYDISEMLQHAADNIFRIIPVNTVLDSCSLKFIIDKKKSEIRLKSFCADKKKLDGEMIILNEKKICSRIKISGNLDRDNKKMQMAIATLTGQSIEFPMLEEALNATLKFDSVKFSYNNRGYFDDTLKLNFTYDLYNFNFFHRKISSSPLSVKKFTSGVDFSITTDLFQIDSTTDISVNGIEFHPYLKKENTQMAGLNLEKFFKSGRLEVKILPTDWDATTFFGNLPEGIFSYVRTIQAKGRLHYSLTFLMDPENLDSLYFSSTFKPEDFKVTSFGTLNFRKLDSSFVYETFDKDDSLVSFLVGPENPDYVPLDKISNHLVTAVLTSEDGSFMFHKGFNEESFRKAIAENIKNWRFVRGGSTITMQFVKNVFLTRNKDVARKIQEAMIVWMLENYHLCSKTRMLEIYFNVIEWGPGIYGIGQASEFYFKKKPSELNLPESIFLAGIIPKPRYYYSYFVQNGVMKPYYKDFVRLVLAFMISRDQISDIDTVNFPTTILLTGNASGIFASPDSLAQPADSALPVTIDNTELVK
jgi:hypothetical protein